MLSFEKKTEKKHLYKTSITVSRDDVTAQGPDEGGGERGVKDAEWQSDAGNVTADDAAAGAAPRVPAARRI